MAIVVVILIFYFNLTSEPPSTSSSSKITPLNKKTYKFWNLLSILAGITLLSLYYLTAVKILKGVYLKLINICKSFKSKTKLPEWVKNIAVLSIIVAGSFLIIIGLFYNGYGWWAISYGELSMRLRDLDEPLNLRYMLIGLAGLMALVFTGWRAYIADQNRILSKSRRFDKRFDNAAAALAEELNESSFPAHLGAISGMRTLAIDSPEHTQRCLDIICSCNQWMERYIDRFIETRNNALYSYQLLNEDNRIGNKNRVNEITLLQEKRSQEALVAVNHILAEISANSPEQLKTLKFHNKMLCGASFSNLKLDGINFNNTYLVAANMNNTSLNQVKLNYAKLQGAFLYDANLQGANLDNASLHRTSLDNANLRRSSLRKAHLHRASLESTNLQGANLDDAELCRSSLRWVNLQGASLEHTNLMGANLDDANLQGSSLKEANLQESSLRYTRLQGANLTNTNLQEAILINTQIQGAKIDYANLSNAMLLNCNLYGATLEAIKCENIIFNNIENIDYIKDKEERIKFLSNVYNYMKPEYMTPFTERMLVAWQAMDDAQEPDGLEIIKESSIITENNQGIYDISKNDLTNLQKRWQRIFNERGRALFYSISSDLLSLKRIQNGHTDRRNKMLKEDISTDKNTNLINKLRALIEQLIRN